MNKKINVDLMDLVEQLFKGLSRSLMEQNKNIISVDNMSVQNDGETNTAFADITYMESGNILHGQIAMYL